MKVVFLGTADIARPVLRALVRAGHDIAAVVTQPDRAKGRSGEATPPPLKEEALALGLACPILQPEKLGRQTRERIAALGAEVGIVVAYGQLLSRELLAVPPRGFLNVHASLLPRWRGAAPVQRAIAAGDAETGVAVMRVEPRLDAGPVLAERATPIGPRETAGELLARLGSMGAELLVETLARLARGGDVVERVQDEARATYAPPIRKEEGAIDWSAPAAAIDARIRGFTPWPGGYAFLHRGKGAPQRVEVLEVAPSPAPAPDPAPDPGTVVVAAGKELLVRCGDGLARVLRVKPAGKREMTAEEWLRGRGAAPGDRLRETA